MKGAIGVVYYVTWAMVCVFPGYVSACAVLRNSAEKGEPRKDTRRELLL